MDDPRIQTSKNHDAAAPLVLVADDNMDIRDLLATRLTSRGFSVVTAADGQEAMEIAFDLRPAIAVLDWVMPIIQGHELSVKLKTDSRTASMPIVILTARGEEEDRLLGLDLGADAYITKPFEIDALDATLKRLIAGGDPPAQDHPRS